MKRILLAAMLAVLVVLPAKFVFSAEQVVVNNLGFAEFLQGRFNIVLPAGSKDLPQDEYFASLAGSLATSGIDNFKGMSYNTEVNFGEVADVLFTLVKGTGNPDTAGKIDYLMNNGFLTEKFSPGMKMTMAELQAIFDNPKLSGFIAQTYVAPEGRGPVEPGTEAPGATSELPASKI